MLLELDNDLCDRAKAYGPRADFDEADSIARAFRDAVLLNPDDLSTLDYIALMGFGGQAFLDRDHARFELFRAELFLRTDDSKDPTQEPATR